jgi:hypothetical protein
MRHDSGLKRPPPAPIARCCRTPIRQRRSHAITPTTTSLRRRAMLGPRRSSAVIETRSRRDWTSRRCGRRGRVPTGSPRRLERRARRSTPAPRRPQKSHPACPDGHRRPPARGCPPDPSDEPDGSSHLDERILARLGAGHRDDVAGGRSPTTFERFGPQPRRPGRRRSAARRGHADPRARLGPAGVGRGSECPLEQVSVVLLPLPHQFRGIRVGVLVDDRVTAGVRATMRSGCSLSKLTLTSDLPVLRNDRSPALAGLPC